MVRIAIIGAGAIGSSLGGLLQRAGHNVVLVGRGPHVRAMQKNGLHVEGVRGELNVSIEAAETLATRPDVAFLTMKTQDVRAAVEMYGSLLAEIPIVTFQNGVRSDDIVASVLPEANIASVVVNFHASFLKPGYVTILYAGPLMLGRPFGRLDDEAHSLAALLGAAFPTTLSGNIRGAHWLKLIVNLNNALPALINGTLRRVYEDPYLRSLAVRMMREGLTAVARAGIKLESLPDTSVMMARAMQYLPVAIAGRLAEAKLNQMEWHWPLIGSTLQSLLNKEPTEIDYLNGEIVRLGKQTGVATPLNTDIVKLVHQVEKTGVFISPDVIRRATETALSH